VCGPTQSLCVWSITVCLCLCVVHHVVCLCLCVVQLFNSILQTLPRQTTSSGGRSPSDIVLDLAADVTGKLPVNYNMEAVCTSDIFFKPLYNFECADHIDHLDVLPPPPLLIFVYPFCCCDVVSGTQRRPRSNETCLVKSQQSFL